MSLTLGSALSRERKGERRRPIDAGQMFSATSGMATLTPSGLAVFKALDRVFLDWAESNAASSLMYPTLIRVGDLDCLNYFRNFPHLVLCACAVDEPARPLHDQRVQDIEAVNASHLQDAEFCLPPAACYNVYLGLRGQDLVSSQHVTTIASCFRNEDHYDGLQRLRAFTLREMVCVGTPDEVKAHLRRYKQIVLDFLDSLGLPYSVETASDPFFDKEGKAARAARIMPTKEEILYRGKLAIGSLNYHRRFFGERCRITMDGEAVHTGCVGFGMERWLHALAEHFGPDVERISAVLAAAHQSRGVAAGRGAA